RLARERELAQARLRGAEPRAAAGTPDAAPQLRMEMGAQQLERGLQLEVGGAARRGLVGQCQRGLELARLRARERLRRARAPRGGLRRHARALEIVARLPMARVEREHLAPARHRGFDLIATEELETLCQQAGGALSRILGHRAYSLSCTS